MDEHKLMDYLEAVGHYIMKPFIFGLSIVAISMSAGHAIDSLYSEHIRQQRAERQLKKLERPGLTEQERARIYSQYSWITGTGPRIRNNLEDAL